MSAVALGKQVASTSSHPIATSCTSANTFRRSLVLVLTTLRIWKNLNTTRHRHHESTLFHPHSVSR